MGRIGEAFGRIWDQVVLAAGAIWEDLKPAFVAFRDNVLIPFLDLVATIAEKFATWAEENPEKLQGLIVAVGLLGVALLLVLSPAALVVAIILAIITVIGLLVKNWEKSPIGQPMSSIVLVSFSQISGPISRIGLRMPSIALVSSSPTFGRDQGRLGNAGDWFQTTIIDRSEMR